MHRTTLTRTLTPLALLITGAALAGPLDPPPGPITSTAKPLAEVEPRIAINSTNTPGDADSTFKITQPGSYYLTGNINGISSRHGIEIASDSVTLDLGGFELVGQGQGGFNGVFVTSSNSFITVRNGTVRNWGDAINLGDFGFFTFRVENVLANGSRYGIYVGPHSTVTGCSAFGGNTGISVRTGSSVSDCSVSNASVAGISAANGCTLTNCSVATSAGNGFSLAAGCVASNCTAYDNATNGFSTGLNCSLTNCSATTNGASGFSAGTSNSFANCSANTNTLHGFSANSGATITACSSYNNSGHGYLVAVGSTVAGCNARSNVLDGIQVSSACTIRGNTCSNSGFGASDGANIHATGPDNRIEDNNCISADRGIEVVAASNVILRNSCSNNAINWVIAANNLYGPIIDRTAAVTPAVSGNSGSDSSGSPHPNANFSY